MRGHLAFFASFELADHRGPVGIDRCSSCESPSKLAVSFNVGQRVFWYKTRL